MEELSLDQDFLTRFSCMGTQDKDVLISQLHGLLDSQISREGCAFFLDMTNWNLQAAVGAFYDHFSVEGGVLPDIALVMRVGAGGVRNTDLSVPVAPNTAITETWTLRNTGSVVWPLGVHLLVKGASDLCTLQHVPLPSLSPGQETIITMEMKTPPSSGVYQCQWRAALPGGALFGEVMCLTVHVQEDEMVSGLVQQLSSFSTDERRSSGVVEMTQCSSEEMANRHTAAPNPFGAPLATEDPSFGSDSFMSGPQSIPSTIEQLLQPSPPLHFTPRPLLQSNHLNTGPHSHTHQLNSPPRPSPSPLQDPSHSPRSITHTEAPPRTPAPTSMEDSANQN